MLPAAIGKNIVDPRILSEQVGHSDPPAPHIPSSSASTLDSRNPPFSEPFVGLSVNPRRLSAALLQLSRPSPSPSHTSSMSSRSTDNLYSNLATYTFGDPDTSCHNLPDPRESVSPFTSIVRRFSPDHTPRPSVSAPAPSVSALQHDCSHPSQPQGRPSFSASSHRYPGPARSSGEKENHPETLSSTHHSDRESGPYQSRRGRVKPDDASQHTFGHGARRHGIASSITSTTSPSVSTPTSIASSRSSSCASLHSDLITSDDDLETDGVPPSFSPITFARDSFDQNSQDGDYDADLADLSDLGGGPQFSFPGLEGRKGSLPMAIPGVSQEDGGRSRETSYLSHRRPSRSLDDHWTNLGAQDPVTIVPKSEPLSRADWRSLEAQVQAQNQAEYDASQPCGSSSSTQPDNIYDGLDLQYILHLHSMHSEGSTHSRRSSAQYSFVHQPSMLQTSESTRLHGIAPWRFGPRRTSSGTIPASIMEDTFIGHIREHDEGFNMLENEWRYHCAKVELFHKGRLPHEHARRPSYPSPLLPPHPDFRRLIKTMQVGQLEIWDSGNIGVFKVDRGTLERDGKGIQARLNVRNISSRADRGLGPSTLIHKHSRATAFSIFRSFSISASHGRRGQNMFLNSHNGIMLAPKKVQEHFTSTRTTRQLATHGLIDDPRRSTRRGGESTRSRLPDSLPPEEGDRRWSPGGLGGEDKKKKKAEDKDLTVDQSSNKAQIMSAPASSSHPSSEPFTEPRSLIASAPSRVAWTSGREPFSDATQLLERTPQLSSPDWEDDRERERDHQRDNLSTRTPHAEAFSTLDPVDIKHYRPKAHRHSPYSGVSLTTRVWRALRSGMGRAESPSAISAAGGRLFHPPWMVTGNRELQDESNKVFHDLNNSFRDVGLLHTAPRPGSRSTHRIGSSHVPGGGSGGGSRRNRGGTSGSDVLDKVPDDCLYMLLPLWVGEMDPLDGECREGEEPSTPTSVSTVPENRQYLLVWYVPFDEDAKSRRNERGSSNHHTSHPHHSPRLSRSRPRRSRLRSHSHVRNQPRHGHSGPDTVGDTEVRTVHLTSFRVIACVVAYDELKHSGVRAPAVGLAASGPAWEALSDIEFPVVGQEERRASETVICVCNRGRERGFFFQPHGLAKLGLCTVEETPSVTTPEGSVGAATSPMQSSSPSPVLTPEIVENVQEFDLTVIGRAAVEMVWLGCLAVTSFGSS